MLCKNSLLFSLVTAFFIFSSVTLGGSESDFPSFQTTPISGIHSTFSLISLSIFVLIDKWVLSFIGEIRNENDVVVVSWGTKRFLAEDEPPLNSSLILAAKRTYRKDPLNNFKRYTGGWNISNRHYWAVSIQAEHTFTGLKVDNLLWGKE